jgi:hypothetical protein
MPHAQSGSNWIRRRRRIYIHVYLNCITYKYIHRHNLELDSLIKYMAKSADRNKKLIRRKARTESKRGLVFNCG